MSLNLYINDNHIFNITHNLNKMADAAGIYEAMWYPEKIGSLVHEILPFLEYGLYKLANNRYFYEQFDPPNGWGRYDDLVETVEKYIIACIKNPFGKITVSR